MDPAEIHQGVDQVTNKDHGDKRRRRSPATTLVAAAVSEVLDDDDLLIEIIVRLGFPTSLVRAALVSKRWLRLAADRAFLARFRRLHPRRLLLGFYLQPDSGSPSRFFPMLPQPEGGVADDATFSLEDAADDHLIHHTMDCRNGRVLVTLYNSPSDSTLRVHSPLLRDAEGGPTPPAVLPAFPVPRLVYMDNDFSFGQIFSRQEAGGGVSYFYVVVEPTATIDDGSTRSTVHVYMLQDGDAVDWHQHLTLVDMARFPHPRRDPKAVLAGDKIYIPAAPSDVVVLDLTAPGFAVVPLPEGVKYGTGDTAFSMADDDASGVFLFHIKELQLRIWLHGGDDTSSSWLLVDTICLQELCANLRRSAILRINHAGDYAEFVFLEIGRCAFYLDIKARTLSKVYQMPEEDQSLGFIHPFLMIWPPVFPAYAP